MLMKMTHPSFQLPLGLLAILVVGFANSITPRIRRSAVAIATPQHPQQQQQRHLQQFCGQCTWSANILCEARAQYLVKNNPTLSISDARSSILSECIFDGSEQVTLSLEAFCKECPWQNMNFDCEARVEFLVAQYKLTKEKAMEGLLKKGECVNPNYRPENAESEEEEGGGGLGIGAIVGLIVAVTALLMGGIIFWAWRRERNRKRDKPNEVAVPIMGGGGGSSGSSAAPQEYSNPQQQLLLSGTTSLPPHEDVVQRMTIANTVNNSSTINTATTTNNSIITSSNAPTTTSSMKKKKSKKKKKSISFAMDRPDPPSELSHCDTSEYKYEDGLHSAKDVDGNLIGMKKPSGAMKISWNDDPPLEEEEADGVVMKKEEVHDPEENVTTRKEEDATLPETKTDVERGGSDPPEADAAAGNTNEVVGATTHRNDHETTNIYDSLGKDALTEKPQQQHSQQQPQLNNHSTNDAMDKKQVAPRPLSESETTTLRNILKSQLILSNEDEEEDADNLLEYALGMIEGGENVEHITEELKFMEMSICDGEAATKLGICLTKFFSDMNGTQQ